MNAHRWMPFAIALLIAAPARAERWTSTEQLPGVASVHVLVRGRERVYFRISQGTAFALSMVGPARVRLTTRAELPAGSHSIVSYQLKVSEGTRVVDQISTETSAADSVTLPPSGALVAKSRTLGFELAAGTHRLNLTLTGVASLLVRIQQGGKAALPAMVSITPISAARSVSVAEGEKSIPYYTVLVNRPVQLRVVGPTSLEVISRLDFDDTMRGTVTYTMRLAEKGRTLRQSEFKTTKATTATYTDLSHHVPSKFDRLRVEIPDGLHEISVELVRPSHGSAEIHARIPEPSVGNQE